MLTRMAALGAQYPRFGYRRIRIFLEWEGPRHELGPGLAAVAARRAGPRRRQGRDLFVPTFAQDKIRIGTMPRTPHCIGQDHAAGTARVSSHAGVASSGRRARQQKRVDFLTGYCGLSLPTLFKRICTMAADGQPFPTEIHAERIRRRKLALHAGNPFTGPVLQAGRPVKTTPTSIASGPAGRLATEMGMRVGKQSGRPVRHRPFRRERMTARAGPFG